MPASKNTCRDRALISNRVFSFTFTLFCIALSILVNSSICSAQTSQKTYTPDDVATAISSDAASKMGTANDFTKSNVQWVLLIDTSHYLSEEQYAEANFDIVSSLWGKNIKQGDTVSVVPYQMTVQESTWGTKVNSLDDLTKLLPQSESVPSSSGGHDYGNAINDTITHIDSGSKDDIQHTVILVFSNSANSEVPKSSGTLFDKDKLKTILDQHNISDPTADYLVEDLKYKLDGTKTFQCHLLTYFPMSLVPISQIAATPEPTPSPLPSPTPTPGMSLLEEGGIGLVILALIIGLILAMSKGRTATAAPSPTPRPSLAIVQFEHTNKRFPASKRMEIYGHGLEADTNGTDTEPAKVHLAKEELPHGTEGHLFTFVLTTVEGVDVVNVEPYIYESTPNRVELNKDTELNIQPANGIEGYPASFHVTIRTDV
jgi:hypothetical protein